MSNHRASGSNLLIAFLIAILPALFVQPALAEFTETVTLDAGRVQLNNLIGAIEVVPAAGSSFELEIRVQGEDATRDRIKIDTKRGSDAQVSVMFPLKESNKYVYPRLGKNSRSSFMASHHKSGERDSWWKALVGALKVDMIEVSGDGKGLEIWADVTVKVPKGARLVVDHGAGNISAANVEGEIDLASATGPIDVSNIRGPVNADTGSGHVSATGITGNLNADTGSGSVTAENVTGDVNADTGSGNVSLTRIRGDLIHADTGSGDVTVKDAICKKFVADTGSGNIDAEGVSTDEANLDTGSGRARLMLAKMGAGPFVLDTGSGGIELGIPPDGSAKVHAETGSGSIYVDFEKENVHRKAQDELDFTIGDGTASVRLDAGSGSIRVSG